MKNKYNRIITERDYKMLRFLWKWKAVSTRSIAKKFYPNIKPVSTYRRLQYLANDGYIKSSAVEGKLNEVWGLKEKGFKYILSYLGDLKSKGFKSENNWHDCLSTAFQLGEWLTNQPDNSQTYSEQQLRCNHPELYPPWVPRSTLHRPDGYSIYTAQNRNVIVAFETELWIKAKSRYESVISFYNSETTIDLVFWLIDSMFTFNSLKRILETQQIDDFSKHHFVLLSDFKQKGWNAKFFEGKYKGHSIDQFLNRNGITTSSLPHPYSDALALLDFRKKPVILDNSPK